MSLRGKLTKGEIERWVIAREHFEGKSDGHNLWIRFRKSDLLPRWYFRYSLGGKARYLSLGSYRDVSLSQARLEASRLRGRLALGIDVAEERAAQRRPSAHSLRPTVMELAESYYARYIENRVKHPGIVRSWIDKRIGPAIGSLDVADVLPSHIDALIESIAKDAPTVSTKVLSRLKHIFNYGVRLGHINSSPASAFEPADAGGASKPRTRWLNREELKALMKAMREAAGWSVQNTSAVKLLLMLAVRKSELIEARFEEFDLSNAMWKLPESRTKSGREILIPLPRQALRHIEMLRTVGLGSEWLFPARKMQSSFSPVISPDTINAALKKSVLPLMANVPKFVIHDFRRTARTHLEAIGVAPHVAERCLNHQVKGLVGVYNRYDYFAERQAALQEWADLLETLES